jgi:hypothetical protein
MRPHFSLPVLQGAIDLILGLFDCIRSTYPIYAGFSLAVGKADFPSPTSAVGQLDNRVFGSLVFHKRFLRLSGMELSQDESQVCSLVYLTMPKILGQYRRLFQKRLVALAGHALQGGTIQDIDHAARIVDGSQALNFARYFRDGGAPHAKHLGEEFLGQADSIARRPIRRLKQPAAEAGFDDVHGVAGTGNPRLRKQDFIVIDAKVANGLA